MPTKQNKQKRPDGCRPMRTMISRRAVVGYSGLMVLGLLSGSSLGQERREPPPEMRERMEQSRAFSERMRTASGPEEIEKIMEEQRALQRARAIENLKEQLGVSDAEWAVVRPRVETVYNVVHPLHQSVRGPGLPIGPVEQRMRELREVLANQGAAAEEIKAKLTALRAAREQARQELVKARQDLRQIMTLRQEAVLVLNGLLD